jgi:hypothetical protein
MPGSVIKPLKVRSPDNEPTTLNWDSAAPATVLYVFSPDCVWCARNANSIRVLTEKAPAYRYIGISIKADGLDNYLDHSGRFFPVYVLPLRSAIKVLHITATPETIVMSSKGIVQKVWFGAYGGRIQSEIQNTFGVILPGLQTPSEGYSPL